MKRISFHDFKPPFSFRAPKVLKGPDHEQDRLIIDSTGKHVLEVCGSCWYDEEQDGDATAAVVVGLLELYFDNLEKSEEKKEETPP